MKMSSREEIARLQNDFIKNNAAGDAAIMGGISFPAFLSDGRISGQDPAGENGLKWFLTDNERNKSGQYKRQNFFDRFV